MDEDGMIGAHKPTISLLGNWRKGLGPACRYIMHESPLYSSGQAARPNAPPNAVRKTPDSDDGHIKPLKFDGVGGLGQKRPRPCENLAQTGDVQGALLDLLLFLPGTPLIIKMRLLRG